MCNDIRQYGDHELADYFDNDESLYDTACCATGWLELEQLATEVFLHTDAQLEVFKTDWIEGRWG